MSLNTFNLVLVGGSIPPAVPSSTRISILDVGTQITLENGFALGGCRGVSRAPANLWMTWPTGRCWPLGSPNPTSSHTIVKMVRHVRTPEHISGFVDVKDEGAS